MKKLKDLNPILKRMLELCSKFINGTIKVSEFRELCHLQEENPNIIKKYKLPLRTKINK